MCLRFACILSLSTPVGRDRYKVVDEGRGRGSSAETHFKFSLTAFHPWPYKSCRTYLVSELSNWYYPIFSPRFCCQSDKESDLIWSWSYGLRLVCEGGSNRFHSTKDVLDIFVTILLTLVYDAIKYISSIIHKDLNLQHVMLHTWKTNSYSKYPNKLHSHVHFDIILLYFKMMSSYWLFEYGEILWLFHNQWFLVNGMKRRRCRV